MLFPLQEEKCCSLMFSELVQRFVFFFFPPTSEQILELKFQKKKNKLFCKNALFKVEVFISICTDLTKIKTPNR